MPLLLTTFGTLTEFEEPTSKAHLWRPYSVSEDGGAEWQTLCVLDARGLDLVGWDPEVSLAFEKRRKRSSLMLFAMFSRYPTCRALGHVHQHNLRPNSTRWNSMAVNGLITTKPDRYLSALWNWKADGSRHDGSKALSRMRVWSVPGSDVNQSDQLLPTFHVI